MPTVSVIIRTKNRPDYLEHAVLSVLAQTYRPLELVVVNDGGEDILSLLESLLNETDGVNLNYITHEQSKGRTQAANAGLFSATGELSIFLDDDDYFDPTHISRLVQEHVAVFDDQSVGAVHCRARAVHLDEQGNEHLLSIQGAPVAKDQLFYQNLMPILTVLFSTNVRNFGIRFDENIDLFEDWDFWLQFHQKGAFSFVDETSCAYRIHLDQSGALDQTKQEEAYTSIYAKWLTKFEPSKLFSLLTRSHQWREAVVAELQKRSSAEQSRIGELHAFALDTIRQKDRDIEHLTRIFQKVEREYIELDAVLRSERDEFARYKEDATHQIDEQLNLITEQTQQLQHCNEMIATMKSAHQEAIATKDDEINFLRRTHPFICLYSGVKRIVRFCRNLFTRNN